MKGLNKELFLRYLERHHPEKLKYCPTIIEIVGDNVVFEMRGHKDNFCVNIKMQHDLK